MKRLKIALIGIAASSMLMASQGEVRPVKKVEEKEIAQVVKTGKEASGLLLKTLGGNMKKHMKAGGPADALSFCATNAASLTAKVDERLGENVSVKRITLKPRNPANEAEGDERKVLEALQTLQDAGVKLPRHLVQKTKSGYRYYKPLTISKKVCLKCHGAHLDPALARQIKKIYPTDKATGYRMGDLRGAVVVDIRK